MTTAPQNPKAFYQASMANAPAAVHEFYTALTEQDAEKLRPVLRDDYTFTGPLGSFDTPEGFAGMVAAFAGWVETTRCIVEGDSVAHTFTYHMTAPKTADVPMCEVFELRDGRILSSRYYFNPADFPTPEPEAAVL